MLTQRAFDVVRAAAIGLYVVFVVLALLAGIAAFAGGALFVVTVLFALLVGKRMYDPGTKWFSCRLLAAIGAWHDDQTLAARTASARDPPIHGAWFGRNQKAAGP